MLRVPLVVVGGWSVGVVSGDVRWRIENTRGWKVLESNLWVKVSEFQTYKIQTSVGPANALVLSVIRSRDPGKLHSEHMTHIRLKTCVRVVFWKKNKKNSETQCGPARSRRTKKVTSPSLDQMLSWPSRDRYETDVLTQCADGEPRWGCREEEEVPPPCRLWFPQSSAVRVCKAIRRVTDWGKYPPRTPLNFDPWHVIRCCWEDFLLFSLPQVHDALILVGPPAGSPLTAWWYEWHTRG